MSYSKTSKKGPPLKQTTNAIKSALVTDIVRTVACWVRAQCFVIIPFFFFLQRKLQWVRCTERVECCQKRTEHARGHRTLAPGEGEYSFGGALALLLVRDVTETQGIQPIAIALAVT